MSWDQWVSNNLMCAVDEDGNTLTSAAILGHDGGVWAQSENFPAITEEEVATIIALLDGTKTPSITLGGNKYIVLFSDESLLRGRKDKEGVILSRTQQALVVGIYTEPNVIAPKCQKLVDSLAENLTNMGY
eukprot:CAMPEP_0175041314 /NCGR_PEP_ID=MMETSP0052_2-20121109/1836_1 /TAXON_ID=51329 ORGANISM="Polytomella parva, Strain SAG 63-3" /NCGR_SAMPLE_ID=MMETSP0052_2 /ASSEMBLY_ACC=CAM_ASM_000194 /LENGTH=130 /DNA_ID=CAMNT_0016303795 /DNA_START=63 /DNA_END=455 /DNA_ORIENTATION=+